MEERDVILKLESTEKNYFARTSFTREEIDLVVDRIREDNEEKLLTEPDEIKFIMDLLISKGYIKISGAAPEIIEIW